jgi:hypothetical protein
MRRLVPLALAALLTVALATPALAARPEKIPNEPIAQSFDVECGFDVELQDYFASGYVKIFAPDKNGESRLSANGGFRSILTSADTGRTIDVSFFGHLKFTFYADGSATVRQSGAALWWFTDPADAGMYGLTPGVYILDGHLTAELDPNGITTEPAAMKNVTVRDLCAELAFPPD